MIWIRVAVIQYRNRPAGSVRAPEDRDQGQEVGHLPLQLDVLVVLGVGVVRRQRHPRGDQLGQRREDGEDADPEAEDVEAGDRRLRQAPVDPEHRRVETRVGDVAGRVEGRGRRALDAREQVDPEHVPHRARVEVGEPLAEHRVHRDQEAHRQQDRQAAAGRVHAALLVELRDGRLLLDPVALVLALQLLDLGLEQLHLARRHELAPVERDHQQPEGDRQQQDAEHDVLAGQLIEEDQPDEQHLEDRREQPRDGADRVDARDGGLQRRLARGRRHRRRAAAAGRAAQRRARGDDQHQRNEKQDRREADEGLLEAGHAVVSRQVSGRGRSRRDSMDGSGRCAWRPSSSAKQSVLLDRLLGVAGARVARTGSRTAATRTRCDTGG